MPAHSMSCPDFIPKKTETVFRDTNGPAEDRVKRGTDGDLTLCGDTGDRSTSSRPGHQEQRRGQTGHKLSVAAPSPLASSLTRTLQSVLLALAAMAARY